MTIRYFTIAIKGLAAFLLILILVVFIWNVRLRFFEPLEVLKKKVESVVVVKDSTYQANLIEKRRNYQDFVLSAGAAGEFKINVSFPADSELAGIPVVIILGGLEIGHKSLTFVQNPGNNVIIIYQYPYSPRYWYEGSAVVEIPVIQKSVLSVPSQVSALIMWLNQQKWADADRISIAGYSFGALFLPAVLNLAQENELRFNRAVLAYGGVNNYKLLQKNLKNLIEPFRSSFAWMLSNAIYPLDSKHHIEFVRNELFLINGNKDKQIPEECWRKLHFLTPDPKDIIILNEGHMHPRKEYLTRKLVDISQRWLIEKGSINP